MDNLDLLWAMYVANEYQGNWLLGGDLLFRISIKTLGQSAQFYDAMVKNMVGAIARATDAAIMLGGDNG